MTKTKNRIAKRVLALTVAILTIITFVLTLSACGDSGTKFRARYAGENDKAEEMSSYVGALVATNESYKLRFIAASRGYNIAPKDKETQLQDIDEGTQPDDAVGVAEGKA